MTDSEPDDARLRSTEEQMRRALGLRGDAPALNVHHPSTVSNVPHQSRRRFVHDGEVPVTMVRRDHHYDGEAGTNQLEAARQAIRSQAAAKERAERSLAEAHLAIRDLQTKLGHERLAKVEALDAVRCLEADRQAIQQTLQTVQSELATERVARRGVEEKLRAAEAEAQRLHEMASADRTASAVGRRKAEVQAPRVAVPVALEPVDGGVKRRRGRPRKVVDQDADIVEWWKPGWREKYR